MIFDRVQSTIDCYFSDLSFQPYVYVSFSGGPDSVFLVIALKHLFPNLLLHLIHFDHGLRKNSIEDVVWIRNFAVSQDCELTVRKIPVAFTSQKKKISIEQSGRYLRYRLIKHKMRLSKVKYCLLGHHNDDRIETFFFRILKGSKNGAESIKPFVSFGKDQWICRPLLTLFKHEIFDYLSQEVISFLTDDSNECLDFDRNKIRATIDHLGLPINSNYKHQVSEFIDFLGETNTLLDRLSGWDRTKITRNTFFYGYKLHEVPSDIMLCKHLVASLFRDCRASRSDLLFSYTEAHIDEMARMIMGNDSRFCQLPLGYFCQYSQLVVYIRFETPTSELILNSPVTQCKDYGIIVSFEYISVMPTNLCSTASMAYLGLEEIPRQLSIRSTKENDRFHLFGRSSDSSVQDSMSKLKVPRLIRDAIPLFFLDNQLAWIPGRQVSESYKVTNKTNFNLCINIEEIE